MQGRGLWVVNCDIYWSQRRTSWLKRGWLLRRCCWYSSPNTGKYVFPCITPLWAWWEWAKPREVRVSTLQSHREGASPHPYIIPGTRLSLLRSLWSSILSQEETLIALSRSRGRWILFSKGLSCMLDFSAISLGPGGMLSTMCYKFPPPKL